MTWDQTISDYVTAITAADHILFNMLAPIHYELPIPGEPLIRRPVYWDAVKYRVRA